jgi:hypothetical protein
MSTVGVCMPGSAGNKCAACNTANQCNAGLNCYLGRCYESCNVNVSNTCSTCVQTEASGVGICGCSDQVSPANGPCGNQPEVHACQAGTTCLNGTCRAQCDPAAPFTCPVTTTCKPLGNANYCQDDTSSTGGGTGAGGGGGTVTTGGGGARTGGGTGGSGGGSVNSEGCGCTAVDAGWLWFTPALLVLRRRRGQ